MITFVIATLMGLVGMITGAAMMTHLIFRDVSTTGYFRLNHIKLTGKVEVD